jgi:hypothetical protein
MSTIAKVFVILNLLASLVFSGFAATLYSKDTKYKELIYQEVDAHFRDNRDKDAIIRSRDQVIESLDRALFDRIRSVQQLRVENENLQRQIREKEVLFIHAEQERQMLQARLEEANTELRRRHNLIDDMHRIILKQEHAVVTARENERKAINERIEMEYNYNRARQQLDDVRREKARLEEALVEYQWMIDTLYAKGYKVAEIVYGTERGQPMRPIEAKVTAVRPETGLVMLSVGADDGVQRGFVFYLWRDDKYIGKATVEKVYQDMCSARLELPLKDEVAEGDNASTRIY